MTQLNLYRIGAASRVTGIPTVTIRMWERRYQVVEPQRTEAGGRLYTQDDLHRLGLIKQAVDAGNAISTVAQLSNDEIQARLANVATTVAPDAPIRVVVVGEFIGQRLQAEPVDSSQLDIVSFFASDAAVPVPHEPVDVLLYEVDYLTSKTANEVSELKHRVSATFALVIYSFATHKQLEKLENLLIQTVKAPVNAKQIERACIATTRLSHLDKTAAPQELQQLLYQPIPARRFSQSRLAELALQSDVVKCECPMHLAELIKSLSAFERFSAACENQNKQDAAMHMLLHVTTAKARRMLEDALDHLVEYENTSEPI